MESREAEQCPMGEPEPRSQAREDLWRERCKYWRERALCAEDMIDAMVEGRL